MPKPPEINSIHAYRVWVVSYKFRIVEYPETGHVLCFKTEVSGGIKRTEMSEDAKTFLR